MWAVIIVPHSIVILVLGTLMLSVRFAIKRIERGIDSCEMLAKQSAYVHLFPSDLLAKGYSTRLVTWLDINNAGT